LYTRTVRFQAVRRQVIKNARCADCGKRVRRSRTFEQTINPFNRLADGTAKDYTTIRRELDEEARAWLDQPEQCKACRS
jgi:tryptophan 2,3-dioxygenase